MSLAASHLVQSTSSLASSSTRICSHRITPFRPIVTKHVCSSRRSGNTASATFVPQASKQVVAVAELLAEEQDEDLLKLPKGYHWYETMIVLRPTLSDEERDKELAKFEAFLNKEECMHINALVRNRARMAFSIKNNWEGVYVLYTYAAKRQTARTVQLLLSNPEAGSEDNVLRHITFCKF